MSWKMLLLTATIVVFTALQLHPSALLLLNFPFVVVGVEDWSIAGVRLNPKDLIIIALTMSVAAGRATNVHAFNARQNMGLWAAIGLLISLGYLSSPSITDPVRAAYQLYRYCWKPIALYPLVLMFFSTDARRRDAMTASIIIGGALAAAMAIEAGYTGGHAVGPFPAKNALGGALLAPLVFSATAMLYTRERRWLFVSVCALILARGMLFSHSRGAMVGVFGGVSLFSAFFLLSSSGMTRLLRYAAAGFALIALLLAAKPSILQRPSIQQMLSSTQGTKDSNMQWRLQQRWPHFVAKIKQRPYLGYGTDRDFSFGLRANTPHNGYLSLCMTYGVPVGGLFVFFGLASILRGIRIYATSGQDPGDRMFALSAAASITGIMIHNLVESTLMMPFVADIYWTLVALIACRSAASTRRAPGSALRRPRPRSRTERPTPRRRPRTMAARRSRAPQK